MFVFLLYELPVLSIIVCDILLLFGSRNQPGSTWDALTNCSYYFSIHCIVYFFQCLSFCYMNCLSSQLLCVTLCFCLGQEINLEVLGTHLQIAVTILVFIVLCIHTLCNIAYIYIYIQDQKLYIFDLFQLLSSNPKLSSD